METAEIEDLITSAEAADILGVDRSGIIRRIKAGQLVPAKTLPGRTGSHLFERAAVVALLENGAALTRAEAGVTGSSPVVALPDPGGDGGSSAL